MVSPVWIEGTRRQHQDSAIALARGNKTRRMVSGDRRNGASWPGRSVSLVVSCVRGQRSRGYQRPGWTGLWSADGSAPPGIDEGIQTTGTAKWSPLFTAPIMVIHGKTRRTAERSTSARRQGLAYRRAGSCFTRRRMRTCGVTGVGMSRKQQDMIHAVTVLSQGFPRVLGRVLRTEAVRVPYRASERLSFCHPGRRKPTRLKPEVIRTSYNVGIKLS